MSKKRLEEGDIFYVEQNGKYFFGKILLDVNNRILKKEEDNIAFKFFSGCYLVAIYKGIYDKPELITKEFIISSAFTFKKYFYSKKYKIEWTFYDNETIDYKQLDFPECLQSGNENITYFRNGELFLKTNLTYNQFDNEYYVTCSIQGYYSLIDAACHYQNRDDLMDMTPAYYLEKSDLRFAPEKRIAIYKQIGEGMSQSYYEMALKYDLDLGRFY